MSRNNIILVGLMGAGKSTIGRILAGQLKMAFFDSDHEIEQSTGVNISTIFEIEGEEGFRQREAAILQKLCEKNNAIIATGGGAVINAENRATFKKSGTCVYLQANANLLYSRISRDKKRPLMQTDDPKKTLTSLLEKRESLYLDVADITIKTGSQRAQVIVNKLVELVK